MREVRAVRAYVVITEGHSTQQTLLGKLNYSGERYEVVATGKYREIADLAAALNEAAK